MTQGVQPLVLQAGGLTLSSLQAAPAGPAKATILALAGGGYGARYWDHPVCPEASLLTLAAGLNYRVISLDRPAYGASARPGFGLSMDRQADIIAALVGQLADAPGVGRGVFLIGHSLGGIVAMMVAARGMPALLGMDVSGVPHRFSDDLAAAVTLQLAGDAPPRPLSAASLFYGLPGSYPPALTTGGDVAALPLPPGELDDSFRWPSLFDEVAAAIAIPVQYSLGDHDRTTRATAETLGDIAARFVASPRVLTHLQPGAGHNISLHHVGRAYHLRALAFFDECLALGVRRQSPPG